MNDAVPVWVWLPGTVEPVQAATLQPEADGYRFSYLTRYAGGAKAPRPPQSVPLDPVALRFKTSGAATKLPGVIHDAKPAGYGQDRLNDRLNPRYQRDLTELELLEEGPADGVGAIEVCRHIDRKLAWRASPIAGLDEELERLEDGAPASRAMRRANGDVGTSAGGERPKATFVDQGRQWIVKMQDRGDRQGLPAMEFTTMTLASRAEITVPRIALRHVGPHQAFMVERFDRAGDPARPQRQLFASAHTVLQLPAAAVRGDERRSYLFLADRMRVWCRGADPESLMQQLQELWRRMAFNALVGNTDDHPRNHGLLFKGGAWQLAPAFDITPVWRRPAADREGTAHWAPSLAMATGPDGRGDVDPHQLIAAAQHFHLDPAEAAHYLVRTSDLIANAWEATIRQALAPLAAHRPEGYVDQVVDDVRDAFCVSQRLAESPGLVDEALAVVLAPRRVGRRRHVPG